MQRGVIIFTNLELEYLHDLLISGGDVFTNENKELIARLAPVKEITDDNQLFDVSINENEAELILDLMPIPNKDDDQNLVNTRIKLQSFLDKK
jgi:hypothetical protein